MRQKIPPFPSLALPRFLAGLGFAIFVSVFLSTEDLQAAEYIYSFVYSGSNYTSSVFVDNSFAAGQVKGVIVTFNYGANVYTNSAWRNFAKDRRLALLLMTNQDVFGIPASTTDMVTVLNNTLAASGTALSHPELAASTLPVVCLGVSRGGTSGAINLGLALGANKTIACLAYHGNSFEYISSLSSAPAKAIPVLYLMAQLDSAPVRQTDIETAVRTTGILSTGYGPFGVRPTSGLFWTTTMQYGSSHASTGDDTYPLQWLGRVWEARYNASTPGTLNSITTPNSLDGSYALTNGASSTAYFASCATTSFTLKDGNIWLLAAGASEWLAESSLPQNGVPYNIDSNYNTLYTAPDNILNRNFINSGSIIFTGTGLIGLDNSGGGKTDYFLMTGGTLVLQQGATLRNGANQGGVWTSNKASMAIDSTSTFDLYDGNPVFLDALIGSGTITILANPNPGARSLTVGVNNGSGVFSGLIAGNSSVDGGSISLTKVGLGTITLNGSCRYSGTTTVQAGTLAVGGTLSATSRVEVANGATLQLNGGLITSGSVHVASGGTLSGYGVVNGPLVNDGTLLGTSGTISLKGAVINNGTMRMTGGTLLSATSAAFVNNGLLDLMTGAQTLPASFVNNGVVLDLRQVQVKQTAISGVNFQVTIQSYVGHNYQLQRSDTIGAGSVWTNVGSAQVGTGLVLTFTDFGGVSGSRRFYRILVSP